MFFKGEPLKHVAQKYDASVAQVLLSWAVQRGISVIPKSESSERLKANVKVRTHTLYLRASTEYLAQVITLEDEDTKFLNEWHKQLGMHRSLCPYHYLEPVVGVFGWTYEQLHWKGMQAGGIIS